jgi:microcystin-dependent protein
MAGIPSPHVADREQRAFNSAVKQRVESQAAVIAQLQAQVLSLQTRPVGQQTTVIRETSGGSSAAPGQLSNDILGALLPLTDPPSADSAVPAGAILPFAGSSTPDGFLFCDGTSYAVSEYPDLHEAIGYTWGGAGANFNVPNLVDRYLMGATGTEPLGTYFGATDHEINLAHKHGAGTLATGSAGAHDHGGTTGTPSATATAQTPISPVTLASSAHTHSISSDGSHTHTITGNTGDNTYNDGSVTDPVDIRPQSAAVRWIIKT